MRLDHKSSSSLTMTLLGLIVSVAILIAPINSTHADDASLDLAIDEYIKGFRACNEANNLRTTDLAQAKANFNYYTQQLSKAISIDETILQTTLREMHTNISYCKRVENNLQRTEASPLLEQGIDFCKSAKSAIATNDLSLASQEILQYQQFKEQALIIAPDLMDVFALASKIRTCTRVEEKLQKALESAALAEEEMKKAILAYQSFKAQCETARQFVNSSSFNMSKLQKANTLLKQAQKNKKSARKNEKAFELAEENPDSENAIALTALINETGTCEGEVSSIIRRTTKTQRSHERQLSNASKSLAAANRECVEAQKELNNPVTQDNLNRLKGIYNASSDVKESITSDTSLLSINKAHKNWPQSKSLNQNLKNTTSCLSILTAMLKATKPVQEVAIIESTPTELENKESETQDQTTITDDIFEENQSETTNETIDASSEETNNTDPAATTEDDFLDDFDSFNENDPDEDKKSWTNIIN